MPLLFNIVYATKANGTHHRLALDALHHLENNNNKLWQRLFLKHVDVYLEGSKAPDKDFKDFRNHVLHVGDEFWGGAPKKAQAWYDKFVRALHERQFEEAVYCAGVLSHYYTDPIQPFHTAQSEAENNMHRAVEWSINKSYKMLRKRGLSDYAGLAVETGDESDWIIGMVERGATRSHQYYDALISNYNLDRGVNDPLEGLNENCHRFLSELLIYASLGFARILDRAFVEAAVAPPQVNLSVDTFVASLGIPMRWVLRKLDDATEIRAVEAAYDELQQTGKVENNLSEDDREVRRLHKIEILERRSIKRVTHKTKIVKPARSIAAQRANTPPPAPNTGTKPLTVKLETPTTAPKPVAATQAIAPKKETARKTAAQIASGVAASGLAPATAPIVASKQKTPATKPISSKRTGQTNAPRFYLELDDEIEKAPSIGAKTATRLENDGIMTVADLLKADPFDLSAQLNTRWINKQVIKDWQDQARLVCEIAGLRGGHAQILVGAGLRTTRSVSTLKAGELHGLLSLFCQTKEGQRIRACENLPDQKKVEAWIRATIEHPRSVAA